MTHTAANSRSSCMRKTPLRRFSRRGVSGLLSAIFLFAMLFTTGAAYILFVTDSQFKMQDTAKSALDRDIQRMSEEVNIETSELGNGHLGASITNTGSEPVQVKQIFVVGASGNLLKNIQSPTLPITLNVQTATATPIDTNVTIQQSANYTVKVITQRGSLFSEAYPPLSSSNITTIISSAISSEIAKSIGSIAMDTTTLQYSQDNGDTWNEGWSVPGGNGKLTVWRVNVTNQSHRDVYLGKQSDFFFLKIVTGVGGGSLSPMAFYIVKNASVTTYPELDSNFIANGGVMVPANGTATKTLYMKIDAAGSGSAQYMDANAKYLTTLELFGKYDSPTSIAYYGQSLPFVGVLTHS